MKLDAVLHIPMSEYCCGLDERHIVYRLRCARGDLQRVTLFYADTACRVNPILFTSVPMEKVLSDACHDYWQVIVDSPYNRVYYYFQLDDGTETKLYYSNLFTDRLAQDRSEYFKLPFNHRSDIARVPAWVKDAVVYNIFPDSFASGKCEISGQPHSQRFGQQTVRGKLGGTLDGVARNVDYLKALGVNCVYLNPIFAAGEYHKYDLLDYYHVDPCFGGNEAFRTMVNTLHASGIRVIIDGVFNHCGWHFFAFEDVVKNQKESCYKDWFYDLTFPVHCPETPEEIPDYACFAYERMMPKLNTANPEVQKYFCDVGAYWVREYGIDGWRLDVAADLGHSPEFNHKFWKEFRRVVKEANPEAIILAEHYGDAMSWLQGDEWDTVMNYDAFMEPVSWFLTGMEKHSDEFNQGLLGNSESFIGAMTYHMPAFYAPSLYTAMNELDNHDHSRFLTRTNHRVGRVANVGPYAAAENTNKAVLREAVVIQMTWPGAPTLYYGDEAGQVGFTDPDNRRTYPWGQEDQELIRFYKEMIAVHRRFPVLAMGSLKFLYSGCGG